MFTIWTSFKLLMHLFYYMYTNVNKWGTAIILMTSAINNDNVFCYNDATPCNVTAWSRMKHTWWSCWHFTVRSLCLSTQRTGAITREGSFSITVERRPITTQCRLLATIERVRNFVFRSIYLFPNIIEQAKTNCAQ